MSEEYVIPAGATEVRPRQFAAEPLTSIAIPESVRCIGALGFSGSDIQRVRFSDGLEVIGEYAFANCDVLESAELPSTLRSLGDHAYENCASLKTVKLPSGLESIGRFAFRECERLTTVEMPDSVAYLGEESFSMCLDLRSVQLSRGLTGIGRGSFHGCESLESVVIPGSVQWIGAGAFQGCGNLRNVSLPASLKLIGCNAFAGCADDLSIVSINDLYEGAFENGWMRTPDVPLPWSSAADETLLDIWNRVDSKDSVTLLDCSQFALWRNGSDIELTVGFDVVDGYNLDPRNADNEFRALVDAVSGLDVIDAARVVWHGRGPADAYIDPLFEFAWFLSRRGDSICFEAPRIQGFYCMDYAEFRSKIEAAL